MSTSTTKAHQLQRDQEPHFVWTMGWWLWVGLPLFFLSISGIFLSFTSPELWSSFFFCRLDWLWMMLQRGIRHRSKCWGCRGSLLCIFRWMILSSRQLNSLKLFICGLKHSAKKLLFWLTCFLEDRSRVSWPGVNIGWTACSLH